MIILAREIEMTGGRTVDFTPFDKTNMDAYAAQAKAIWGNTPQYQEFQEKDKARTPKEQENMVREMMSLFGQLGGVKEQGPGSDEAQRLVKRLQDFITEHFYTCSDKTLSGLGKMYGSGGEFTKTINDTAGEGTGEFAAAAIEIYCR